MSVIGISPSDIINGARVIGKGLASLKEDGGSKTAYQQTSNGLIARANALNHLEQFADSIDPILPSNAVRDAVKQSKDEDTAFIKILSKYEHKLGAKAAAGKKHGIARKVAWAFCGEQNSKDYSARASAGIDAAILEAIMLVDLFLRVGCDLLVKSRVGNSSGPRRRYQSCLEVNRHGYKESI